MKGDVFQGPVRKAVMETAFVTGPFWLPVSDADEIKEKEQREEKQAARGRL